MIQSGQEVHERIGHTRQAVGVSGAFTRPVMTSLLAHEGAYSCLTAELSKTTLLFSFGNLPTAAPITLGMPPGEQGDAHPRHSSHKPEN